MVFELVLHFGMFNLLLQTACFYLSAVRMSQVKKSFVLCSVRHMKQVDVVVMMSTCTLNILD